MSTVSTPASGRMDRALAALVLATLPTGNIVYESGGRSLLIAYSFLVGAVLVAHLGVAALARRPLLAAPTGRALRLAAVLLLLMWVPVLAGSLEPRSLVAYASFAGGTVCGLVVAAVWMTCRARFSVIDLALVVFILATAVQLRLSSDDAASLHHVEVTWGASNYVAGALVVASLAMVARLLEARAPVWLWSVPLIGYASALLTLSRGAAVSGAIGLVVILWNLGKTVVARAALRLASIGLVVAVGVGFTVINDARSVGGYDPSQNIDARVTLITIAWDQFLSSPFTGTGWLALRDVDAFATPISFAHNVIFSFLQIGGLFGAIFLVVLAVQVRRAWTASTPMFAAVAAAIAMSFSDPFLEGGVGALFTWLVVGYCVFGAKPASELGNSQGHESIAANSP